MTFADFVGNPRLVTALQRMLASGRVPHALLFSGQRGVGKFTLATLFARAANCERQEGDICERCGSCTALAALEDLGKLKQTALDARGSANPESVPLLLRPHPSVTTIVPDGAFIRVSQMRAVCRQAYTLPAGVRRNLFLIDEAERLRFDYADLLLKVLEEPPERTTLILVTAAPFKLRATIRSRCIPFYFAPLTTGEIERYLARHRSAWTKQGRGLAAAAADGSLGTALSLDLPFYRQVRADALALLWGAAGQETDPGGLFGASASLAGKGSRGATGPDPRESLEFSLDILYSLLADVVHLKYKSADVGLRNSDIRNELQQLSRQVSEEWLAQAVQNLDRVEGWQRRNINRQLALDAWALGSALSFVEDG